MYAQRDSIVMLSYSCDLCWCGCTGWYPTENISQLLGRISGVYFWHYSNFGHLISEHNLHTHLTQEFFSTISLWLATQYNSETQIKRLMFSREFVTSTYFLNCINHSETSNFITWYLNSNPYYAPSLWSEIKSTLSYSLPTFL